MKSYISIYICIKLGGSVHTRKKRAEALVVVGKEAGLQVNTGKTKCMVMSGDQNAGRRHD